MILQCVAGLSVRKCLPFTDTSTRSSQGTQHSARQCSRPQQAQIKADMSE